MERMRFGPNGGCVTSSSVVTNSYISSNGILRSVTGTTTNESSLLYTGTRLGIGTINPNTNLTATPNYSTFINQHSMQQVKVGVFKVTRSEETQKVIGTQFLKEMWVEVKPNADLKLIVASKLTKEDLQGADLSELDIRELITVTFY